MDAFLWLAMTSVFTAGLLSGVHCAGMCGGIVGVVSMQLPNRRPALPFQLVYNGGRILSYTVAGIIVGVIGQGGLALKSGMPVQHVLFALASTMMIVMGFYLAGFGKGVRIIENVGSALWKKIQPYTCRLLPVDSLNKAFWLGMAWGWLPCGLVYTVLLTALAMGNAWQGGLIMLAFGIGTLPNLLALGLFYSRVKKFAQSRPVRLCAGLLVAGVGCYGLYKLATGMLLAGQCLFCHSV
ncbi:MAG: sulfite exporter TauE/SafE family protein [Gallionellaceae bacterium]|nr:sulfite exporter TauE/SafE family protein [Gallionellaceae bacterium]